MQQPLVETKTLQRVLSVSVFGAERGGRKAEGGREGGEREQEGGVGGGNLGAIGNSEMRSSVFHWFGPQMWYEATLEE